MFKKLTSGLMIALGMILMPVINIALDPALEIKAFEETEGLTLADTVEWDDLNGLSLREVFEVSNKSSFKDQNMVGINNTGSVLYPSLDFVNNEYMDDEVVYVLINYYIGNMDSQAFYINFYSRDTNDLVFNFPYIIATNQYDFKDYQVSFIRSLPNDSKLQVIQMFTTTMNMQTFNFGIYDMYYISLTSLGIDNLTVEQIDYYYQKYIEYKEIKAILTPPLDVDGCDVAAGCYSYFELGRVMFYDGLLSMVPREVNDRISFPIFSNLLSFAKNGAVYLINPLLSFLSDFVPFIKVDNSDVVYTDVYHDETWVYNKGSYYETDNHSFYYYNEVLSTKKIWWYWNATESKYIGYDNVDKIYRYYYHTVTFLGSGYWTQSKLAISSEEMRKYNVTYGWKE